MRWDPPHTESQNGIIIEYVVNVTAMETEEHLQLRTTGSMSSLNITSLHPDYTYTYTVASSTGAGSGPFSPFRSIRMPEDVKLPTYYIIVNLALNGYTKNRIGLYPYNMKIEISLLYLHPWPLAAL